MQELLIQFTLDIMHYEHHFSKTILKTMINGKNTLKVKHDLQHRGIRPHLWLIIKP